jgi:hypothetical protein
MNTEEQKGKTDKAKCTGFKGCQEIFEKMEKCCTHQDCYTNCSAMMEGMMKEKMKKCCKPKVNHAK